MSAPARRRGAVAPAGDMTRPGRLITFEGGEGAGKSTQVRRLAEALCTRPGPDAVVTREPGGTPGAEAIRALLVEGPPERWPALTETLLVLAARHDHVVRRHRAGARGRPAGCICDRFGDSTRVYQGIAGGAGWRWSTACTRRSSATSRPISP